MPPDHALFHAPFHAPFRTFQGSTAHARLGLRFFQPVKPAAFAQHVLRFRNDRHAEPLGLGHLDDAAWIDHFARFEPLPDSHPGPIALAYHGHQFQHYNPDLGDGRGFLFAQCREPGTGRILDFGTKGSGRTPWSRGGDGRLTLKGAVREILASEMLEALGVDTSKTFSVVETGEALTRGDEPSPTRSAVLVRLSHGHIRIGSFQRQAHLGDISALEALVRYSAQTYLGLNVADDTPIAQLAVDLLRAVAQNTARTAADWMAAGFVHGVLNTDNINITGESFDYGPWRFLPDLEPEFTAAYFDDFGLYAYGRQPGAVAWNVDRLAESLAALAPIAELTRAVEAFEPAYDQALRAALARRLGIAVEDATRIKLAERLFPAMAALHTAAPDAAAPTFEQIFFDCYGGHAGARRTLARDRYAQTPLTGLVAELAATPPAPQAQPDHPYFQGPAPETMLIDEVEAIWAAIDQRDDWGPLYDKVDRLRAMSGIYTSDENRPQTSSTAIGS